jgi:predicted dehydrogenase
MIEAEGLDALYVCIPPGAHTDAEILAARKGIHLFVEKPVTLDPDLGLRILQEIRKAGVFSSVGYSLRYIPAARAMRDFLKDKTIAMVTSNRWGGVPETPWWRVMAQSGGQLVEQTTHQVDLMRYLAGDVVEVHARYAQRAIGDLPNATIPDVQVVNFLFSSGAIGNLSTSCALTRGGGKSDLTVILRDMTIGYGREVTVTPPGAASIRVPPDPIPDIDASFIQAIRSGNPSWIESSYEDGLKSAIVCLAANRSADTGRPVGIEKGGLGILDPG